jgi:hypothetical protein
MFHPFKAMDFQVLPASPGRAVAATPQKAAAVTKWNLVGVAPVSREPSGIMAALALEPASPLMERSGKQAGSRWA